MKRFRLVLSAALALVFSSTMTHAELTPQEKARIETLIRQMGDKEYRVREEATRKLIETGANVLPLVRKTFEETDDPELVMRCQRVLRDVKLPERVIRDLGTKPEGLVQIMRSADRKTIIYRVARDGKLVLIHKGKESPPYDSFREYYLTNDLNRVLYVGRTDKTYHAVIDGEAREYEYAAHMRVSVDGKHVAYIARRDKKYLMVLDGKELPICDTVWGITFVGEHVVAGARKGERWVYAMDASEGPEHDKVFPAGPFDVPRYAAIDGPEVWLCRVALLPRGEPLPEKLAEVRVRRLALLDEAYAKQNIYVEHATTRDVLLRGTRIRDCRVYFDGKLIGIYERLNGSTSSPDGERLAVIARQARAYHVLHEDKSFGPYDGAQQVTFSPNGKRLAFGARRGGQWFVVCDGKESETTSFPPNRIVFSPDGAHVAAQFGDGTSWSVMLDGKSVGRYSRRLDGTDRGRVLARGGLRSSIRPASQAAVPAFSPDGRHLAWVGGRGNGVFIVVDGREGPPYGRIDWLRFSADGNHLCYLAHRRAGPDGPVHPRMVVDNIEAPSSETVIQPHDKYPLDRLTYITLAPDNHFKLVEVPWPKAWDWTNGLGPATE